MLHAYLRALLTGGVQLGLLMVRYQLVIWSAVAMLPAMPPTSGTATATPCAHSEGGRGQVVLMAEQLKAVQLCWLHKHVHAAVHCASTGGVTVFMHNRAQSACRAMWLPDFSIKDVKALFAVPEALTSCFQSMVLCSAIILTFSVFDRC